MLDADGYPEYNIDPLVCVLSGAGINQDQAAPTQLPVDVAEAVAEAFYREAKIGERAGQDRGALMISRLSDFGHCNVASNANPVLDLLVANGPALKIECDAHREALIANSVNALTVRGQSFLVVIRARRFRHPAAGQTTRERHHALDHLPPSSSSGATPNARYPDGSLYPGQRLTPFHMGDPAPSAGSRVGTPKVAVEEAALIDGLADLVQLESVAVNWTAPFVGVRNRDCALGSRTPRSNADFGGIVGTADEGTLEPDFGEIADRRQNRMLGELASRIRRAPSCTASSRRARNCVQRQWLWEKFP